jgi:hypothetical protein
MSTTELPVIKMSEEFKKETEEAIQIMQQALAGEQIEMTFRNTENYWAPQILKWNFDQYKYRVKDATRWYRHWTPYDVLELMQTGNLQLREKKTGKIFIVTSIGNDFVNTRFIENRNRDIYFLVKYDELLKEFEYTTDGTNFAPCGVRI